MKCKNWRGDLTAWVQAKLDGIWITASYDGRVYSSQGTDLTDQCREIPSLKNIWLRKPQEVAVYGELVVPNAPASEVKSALAHDPAQLRFVGFATSGLPENAALPAVAEAFQLWGLQFANFTRYADDPRWKHGTYPTPEWLTQQLGPAEGLVFKDGNLSNWQKWKAVKTCDLQVVDYKDGTGKFLGLTGALIVADANGKIRANVSGMTDKERIDITLHEEEYLGRIVEVEYQYVGSGGRLRHPRFKQWRDDKRVADTDIL